MLSWIIYGLYLFYLYIVCVILTVCVRLEVITAVLLSIQVFWELEVL